MKQITYVITDPVGIHARPAGQLVNLAKTFTSKITVAKADGKAVSAVKLMAMMGLGIKTGDTITVTAEGEDEEKAIEAVQKFLQENL